jgi:hypothetical protein
MINASYVVVDTLEQMWLRLARWYPPNHFDGQAVDYISHQLAERAKWQRLLAEPRGTGKCGTDALVTAAFALIGDADRMVVETVGELVYCYGSPGTKKSRFDFRAWKERWDQAKVRTDITERPMRTAINKLLADMEPEQAQHIINTVLADEDPPFTVPVRDPQPRGAGG